MSQQPNLPDVPLEIRKRNYEPSGKCPPLTIVVMIIGAVISAPLVFTLGFMAVGWLLAFLIEFIGDSRNNGLLILGGFIALPFYFIVSGFFVGAASGGIVASISYYLKSRSWFWNLIAGILAAVAGGIIIFTENRQLIPIFQDMEWFDWLYIVEFAIASVCVAVLTSFLPFCEACNQWYREEVFALLPLSSAESLIDSVNKGTVNLSEDLQKTIKYPRLAVAISHCPNCEASNEILIVKVAWKEEKENAVEESSEWLSTLVSPDLGKSFREKLSQLPVEGHTSGALT